MVKYLVSFIEQRSFIEDGIQNFDAGVIVEKLFLFLITFGLLSIQYVLVLFHFKLTGVLLDANCRRRNMNVLECLF